MMIRQINSRKEVEKKKEEERMEEGPSSESWVTGEGGITESIERRKSENLGMKKKEKVIVGRSKSLSDEDLDELKGCLDLGFGFRYEEIPELCNTLPALQLCYSMSHSSSSSIPNSNSNSNSNSNPNSNCNWRISSPGDHPEDVKARLKFWAQAVACTVKLCT